MGKKKREGEDSKGQNKFFRSTLENGKTVEDLLINQKKGEGGEERNGQEKKTGRKSVWPQIQWYIGSSLFQGEEGADFHPSQRAASEEREMGGQKEKLRHLFVRMSACAGKKGRREVRKSRAAAFPTKNGKKNPPSSYQAPEREKGGKREA